jgi:N12 class adenine-specific DNA methylase
MKQTINFYQFYDAFKEIRPDNFSYEGLQLLFEHLESVEEETGQEIELYVIAICCDYSENTIDDIVEQYDIDVPDYLEEKEEITEYVSEQLEKETLVVGVTDNNTIVYLGF